MTETPKDLLCVPGMYDAFNAVFEKYGPERGAVFVKRHMLPGWFVDKLGVPPASACPCADEGGECKNLAVLGKLLGWPGAA